LVICCIAAIRLEQMINCLRARRARAPLVDAAFHPLNIEKVFIYQMHKFDFWLVRDGLAQLLL